MPPRGRSRSRPQPTGAERPSMFVALMLEPELGQRLADPAQRVLGVPARGLSATAVEDLHVTLCFAGPLLSGEAREMESNLGLCLLEAPAPKLLLEAPGCFPRRGKERVLTATVREPGGERLLELAERAAEAAELSGLVLGDARPFVPHVTLARLRVDRHGSRPRVPPDFYALDFGLEWQPTHAAWVESVGNGEPYRVVAEYPLAP